MELALEVKFISTFTDCTRPWWRTLTNGIDVKHVFRSVPIESTKNFRFSETKHSQVCFPGNFHISEKYSSHHSNPYLRAGLAGTLLPGAPGLLGLKPGGGLAPGRDSISSKLTYEGASDQWPYSSFTALQHPG